MLVKTQLVIISLCFCISASAQSLLCHIPSLPKAQPMKLKYQDYKVTEISLLDESTGKFELLDSNIIVISSALSDLESFSVHPNIKEDIDWSKEPNCFKEIGTQWYFSFYKESGHKVVQFYPYFVKSYDHCKPPRFPVQNYALSCIRVNF